MANQIVVSAGAKVRNLSGVLTGTSGVVNSLPINASNGIPQLDVNGKILVSQLPNSVMEYQGVWNANTNTPTLTNGGAFNQGDVYLCNVAGTTNFGAGPISFIVGDQAIFSSIAEGSIWQKAGGASGSVTSISITESGDSLNITGSPITTSGTINIGFNGTNLQYVNGAGNLTTFPTLITSIGLTMPSAFSVANSPLTANGTIAVTGAGFASQYIRGDGTLADFPSSGGGGSSVSYYLNGGTSQGTIGGVTYYEMSKTAVIGTGVDFTKTGDGFIVAFLTDANDPAQLNIPAGNWNYEIYASMSSNGGTPQMYAELYKYDGTTFTLISTSSNEIIYDGTALNLYTFAMAVPATSLTLTDRLAVKLYSTNSGGKTTTIHTQDGHLCQIITTFSTGITALNGLTAQVQYFQVGTSGTDFNISSTTATHTFNIPDASATARGLITTGTQTIAGTKTFSDATKNNGGIFLQNGSSGSTTGYMNFGGTLNGFRFTNDLGVSNNFTLPSATGYTFTFPNATGTLALTSDISYPVTSVFGRTGAVVATSGDYTTTQVTEGTNLYYTDVRARASNSFVAGSGAYNSTTGVITIPTDNSQIANGAGYITSSALSAYLPLAGGTLTGSLTLPSNTASGNPALYFNYGANAASRSWRLCNDVESYGDFKIQQSTTQTGSTYADILKFTSTGGALFVSSVGATLFASIGASSGYQIYRRDTSAYAGVWYSAAGSVTLDLAGAAGTVLNFASTGVATLSNLSGTGTRMVVADSSGVLSTQAIPSAGISGSGTTNYLPKFTGASTIGNSNLINDASGNLGLGVTPSAWSLAGLTAMQIKNAGFFGYLNNLYASANAYYNAGWKYIANANAAYYSQNEAGAGFHAWYNAPSGTADAAITWTQAMTLFSDGNLLLTNGTISNAGYKLDVNGTGRFSGILYANANIVIGSATNTNELNIYATTSPTIKFQNSGADRGKISSNSSALVYNSLTGNGHNFQIDGVDKFTLAATTGAATFSSTVLLYDELRIRNSSYGASYNTSLRSISGASGVLQFGNNGDNYILAGNTAAGGYLIFRVNCASESITAGTEAFRLASNAAATFTSSVTATSFFESSDSRLKTLIQDNYQTKGIASITPKLYTKNGKIELGYYAQDFVGVLDSAVSKGSDDMLSLSYREVLVAKVYALEQEIKELKAK